MWASAAKYLFCAEVAVCINPVLEKSFIFVGVRVLLNYSPVVWGLTTGQQKWNL